MSRLISSQKERDFVNTNYDDIKQVFSIWICMNMDDNSLSHIHLTKDEMLKPCNWKGNLDLLNIVLIGITNEIPEHDEKYEMHRLIGALLSSELKEQEKLDIIEHEYNIPISQEFREDVSIMCNLSQGIEDKAIAKIVMNMYKIGYIDDHPDQYENYRKKIKRRFPDIDLILFDGCKTKEEFLERIYKEQVDVMLIDYKMAGTFSFDGSTLINYINDQVRDLECFILTGVEQDKVADGLVAERNRYSKTIFDTEGDDEEKLKKFFDFINVLIESANVFRTRREQKKEEYKVLYEKRKKETLSLKEEEEYLRLYKVLSSYGMIEELPKEVLTIDFEEKLDHLLRIGDAILEKHREE